MYCKSCGESLTLGAQFCGKCGTLVAVAKSAGLRCPKCGAINPPAAKFCRQDGTSLVDAQVTSQEPHADAPSGDNAPRIWLVLGALAVLVCAGGGYWYYKNRSTSPQLKETALVEGSQAPATPSAPLSQQSDVPEGPPTPAPNDAPPPDLPQFADAPNVQIGDRWVTEVVDHQDATLSYRAERTATDVGPDRIVTAVRTLGKDYVRTAEYNGQWALVATHLRSGATTTYSPALPYLSFPLQPGKSWEARVVETDAEGKTRVHVVSAQVESWENVQVPAGYFSAIKVVLTDDISKDGVIVQQGRDVSWYAPEARRTVKTEETSFDPVTGERRRRTISLMEYSLQSAQAEMGVAATESAADMSQLAGDIVYEQACVACHGAGIAGAPRFGDKAAWAGRIEQGLTVLYAHALQGYQGTSGYMPPKGGRTDLTDQSVMRAVDYIVTAGQ